MVTLYDSSDPGNSNLVNGAGAINIPLPVGKRVYLALASNTIAGQISGPTVTFTVNSRRGNRTISLQYGTTYGPQLVSGTSITATLPAPGTAASVNIRLIVAEEPPVITVETVGAALVPASGVLPRLNLPGQTVTSISANTNLLTGGLGRPTPLFPPAIFRLQVAFDQTGVFSIVVFNSALPTGQLIELNSGNALSANCLYIFDVEVFAGDSIDVQYSVGANILCLKITEIDQQS
jgi:hypothetical protein